MSKDKNNIQIETVDKMIKMYPQLKKDRTSILTNIIGNNHKQNSKEYEVIKFTINDQPYYKDQNGSILSGDAEIIGVYEYKANEYKYYLFKNYKGVQNKVIESCNKKMSKLQENMSKVKK